MKKRTQAKFVNAVISSAKMAFTRYSPKVKDVLDRCRVTEVRYRKDGVTPYKVLSVWAKCEKCEAKIKKIEVDHKDPVIPTDRRQRDMSLDEIMRRLDCDPSNLWGVCEQCHLVKSQAENKARRENTNKR